MARIVVAPKKRRKKVLQIKKGKLIIGPKFTPPKTSNTLKSTIRSEVKLLEKSIKRLNEEAKKAAKQYGKKHYLTTIKKIQMVRQIANYSEAKWKLAQISLEEILHAALEEGVSEKKFHAMLRQIDHLKANIKAYEEYYQLYSKEADIASQALRKRKGFKD